jgi:hypothetical protein
VWARRRTCTMTLNSNYLLAFDLNCMTRLSKLSKTILCIRTLKQILKNSIQNIYLHSVSMFFFVGKLCCKSIDGFLFLKPLIMTEAKNMWNLMFTQYIRN